MNAKKKIFNLRLSQVDFKYLDGISEHLGLNRSYTIRLLINTYYRRKTLVENDYTKARF